MANQLVGKGNGSSVWHLVRAPYFLEGVDIDRDTHVMSLCSHVWTIVETRRRTAATCKHCLKQEALIQAAVSPSDGHRNRQRAAVLTLP